MKIIFLIRKNNTKTGGDLIQINEYVNNLNSKGHRAYITSKIKDIDTISPDCIVLSNIDREFEFFSNLNKISRLNKKIKIICHPIHHPKEWVKNIYLAFKNVSIYRFLNYEKYIFLFNFLELINLINFKIYNYNKKNLLKKINKFIFLSDLEKEYFEKDFAFKINNYSTIPNGTDFIPDIDIKKNGIIVVGRIEPRKNSVNLALILSELNIKSTFVGSFNKKYFNFNSQFKKILTNSKNIQHFDEVNRKDVNKLISASKILVSSSYAEVFPLIELEAIASHTAVLSTTNTLSKTYYKSDSIKFIDPNLLCKEIIIDFYHKDNINFQKLENWSTITDRIIEAYSECPY